MSVHSPTEALVEDVTAVYFGVIGAQIRRGVEIDDASERLDSGQCVLQGRLSAALHRLNPVLPHEVIEGVVRTLAHPPHPTLVQNNRWLHRLLSNGVEVEYRDPRTRETRGGRCRLMDFDDPLANDLLVVRQLAVTGPSGKLIRLDLVVFLNGLPIVVIELKDPTNPHADLTVAIEQLDRYQATVPDLFVANLVRVVSDGMLTRVGSITSDRSRFMPWRPLADDGCGAPTLEAMIRGLFEPRALLDYLRTCVAFEEDAHGEIVKKIAGYHQFRAVRRARTSVLAHLRPAADGRGGVIWHTQGSGKSLTMLMLAGALIREPDLANPTRVLITDRNDLDDQLFDTFAAGRALLRQDPMQATSRDRLRDLLDLLDLLDRAAGGVVFTTIHKFAEAHGVISERANVVVLADEAHRSQYGFVEGGARCFDKTRFRPRVVSNSSRCWTVRRAASSSRR
uniref:type I restriction endonuclease n=1 Tax=Thiocapsa sp. TaxID=2024551 RepID=UPI0035933E85